jgi:hypothetical protein
MGRWAACASVWVTGCATVIPLQPASTVRPGGYLVGAQVSASPWCGSAGNAGGTCSVAVPGTPLPEVRVSARRGLWDGLDLGASLHVSGSANSGQGTLVQPMSAGMLVDGKVELWERPLGEGRRQVISVGVGVGFSSTQPNPLSNAVLSTARVDAVVPVFYGYQTSRWEWVVSPRVDQQLAFEYQVPSSTAPRALVPSTFIGLSLAGFTRQAAPWAFGVEVRGPASGLGESVVTVSAGKFWAL